jgi:uncharacterized membrane protein
LGSTDADGGKMMEMILGHLKFGIGIVGVTVIAWGALVGVVQFLRIEVARIRGRKICRKREEMRHHLGSYILLGLEFLIAADVMHTIIEPSLHDVAILGSIVAIRTVLSFFLNRELATHICAIPTDLKEGN